MVMSGSEHVKWHKHRVSLEERRALYGQTNKVVWFTGLPSSGKSTLAHALDKELYDRKIPSYVLDGDNMRHGLNANLGFSASDREENIRRIGEVAKLFYDAGITVLVCVISPTRKMRDDVRTLIGKDFIEVFVDASVAVCESRDPKGLYKKARAGQILEFTGVSAPYEAPLRPDVHLRTDDLSITDAIATLLRKLGLE